MAPYVELHARSAFSFLEGASLPEELAERCADFDQPAIAMLDRDNLSGIVRFYNQAKKRSVRAHIGCEITAADGSRFPLLAENRTGYQNLCRLITKMKMRSAKGKAAATLTDFEEFAEGVICLTGDEHGPLAAAIKQGKGRQCLQRLRGIFGPSHVYAELQRHLHREEEHRNKHVAALARSMGVPLLATNGVQHARPQERELMDVFTCLRNKTTMEKAGRLLSWNAERYMKSTAQMVRLFADLPEAIANTSELSNRLQFELSDFGYEFPRYPVPEGETMSSFLRKITVQRAPRRFKPYTEKVQRQLEKELDLIEKLKLEGYFLIVWEITEFCSQNGILSQGRGSAANSAVCFALGMTAVDPVKMELLFERFLSEERGEWPDIDIDLPSGDQRERVIQHVYERYGKRGAAMTANIITYRGRSAVRDIGKVLGFDAGVLAKLARFVPHFEWKDAAYTTGRQFRDAGLDPDNAAIRKFMDLYMSVQDLPRHLGQHSGGMVVCQGQLDSIVPLEPATMPGRVVIQWDKEDCADMGLVKVDLLGLGMMAVLEDTTALIRRHHGEEVDLSNLPQDDDAVYSALQKADTVGWFQVESRAQMSCLPRMMPRNFYDVAVQVAIIRPGPIVGKMLHPYLRRRQGKEAPDSLHPLLDEVLSRTLGVPLFQEQLLRMAMIASGFTGGQAEELRRALGFKRSEARMREVEVNLRAGMTRNGIVGEVQDSIVLSITAFAKYGFPESHAISFALIAYASGYLKCHYLAAFTTAMLNNQPMGFYRPSTLVKDAQRHGLRVKPVHVNESGWLCTVEDRATMRLGLNYVKGLHKEAGEAIASERERRLFHSVDDLRRRVPRLHRDQIACLASIGALNFDDHRRSALWESARLAPPSGDLLSALEPESAPCPLQPMTPFERLNADIRGTSIAIGRHPVSYAREMLNRRKVLPAAELSKRKNGSLVRVAGCIIVRQRPGTAKGFVFLSMEDETGISNVILHPEVFERYKEMVVAAPFLLVGGTLQNLEGVVSVKARFLEALNLGAAHTKSHDFH
ncbi:MAG TPA: error-prone DNA polymerase [Bryobacteraceae bacterium]|nr:error-prone DNA polymerase [Bryobacteraceae bacterium]